LRLNTEAVFLLCNRVFPLLSAAPAGCIVNIGCAAGWARQGIRANVIASGPTAESSAGHWPPYGRGRDGSELYIYNHRFYAA